MLRRWGKELLLEVREIRVAWPVMVEGREERRPARKQGKEDDDNDRSLSQ